MATFEYVIKQTTPDRKVKTLRGEMIGASETEVRQRLRTSRDVYVVSVCEAKAKIRTTSNKTDGRSFLSGLFSRGYLKPAELAELSDHLYNMVDTGIPLVQGIGTLAEQSKDERLRKALTTVVDRLENGRNVAAAFGEHNDLFPQAFIAYLEAGTLGGSLEKALVSASEYYEMEHDSRDDIKSAFNEPAMLLGVTFIVLLFVLGFILPKFQEMFIRMKITLPPFTQGMLNFVGWLKSEWWFLLLLLVGLGFSIKQLMASEAMRLRFDRLILSLPSIGPVLRDIQLSRFCQSLGSLLDGGVPIMQAFEISCKLITNRYLNQEVRKTEESLSGGRGFASLLESKEIPIDLRQLIAVGEKTARLDVLLLKKAASMRKGLKKRTKLLAERLKPVMFVVTGLIIAVVMFSVLVPMYDYSMPSAGKSVQMKKR